MTIKETKVTGKVNVEMTELEKEEFVALQASKTADQAARDNLPMVSVDLAFRHEINNTKYGPGPITVRSDIAQTLNSQDQKATYSRMRETGSSINDIQILAKGINRTVRRNA